MFQYDKNGHIKGARFWRWGENAFVACDAEAGWWTVLGQFDYGLTRDQAKAVLSCAVVYRLGNKPEMLCLGTEASFELEWENGTIWHNSVAQLVPDCAIPDWRWHKLGHSVP